ncbi:MAG: lasso peptide biosynthesis B2 protein [Acidobacteria bacterium]|nr:lasso peptide biosynthesis B2 protein [Acidobacteriota bacterium]
MPPIDTRSFQPAGAAARAQGYRSPLDLVLFFEALLAAHRAQGIRSRSFSDVVASLVNVHLPLRTSEPPRAIAAAIRALTRGKRHSGWLDTCLTRSLTAAVLVKAPVRPALAIGFRPSLGEAPVDGHAWLLFNGHCYDLSSPGDLDARPFSQVLTVPMIRSKPGERNHLDAPTLEPLGHGADHETSFPARKDPFDE